jgi:hypothetical protein
MKVPRQCPLVLLEKVGWREEKAFQSGEVEARMYSKLFLKFSLYLKENNESSFQRQFS